MESKSSTTGVREVLPTETRPAGDFYDIEVAEYWKDLDASPDDLERAKGVAANITLEDAREILKQFLEEHGKDMLIPREITNRIEGVYKTLETSEKVDRDLEIKACLEAALLSSNSPYREVRAVYDPDDDPNTPCGTIRAWVIGLMWALGIAAINQFFYPRSPSITVSVYLAQMFSYPMGLFCEKTLPTRVFLKGSRFEFTLNPGPFSLKEHMLITIMSNVTVAAPEINSLFFVQQLDLFLGQKWAGQAGYQICMLLSTQLLGFSLAGLCRRFLVYPPQMIWYFTLSQGALNKALHNVDNPIANGWRMSRFKFFFIACGAMFCYYWLPGVIFPTLSFFNWMTWIKPQNAVLSLITGSYYFNLGLNPWASWDWNWFATIDPIVFPTFLTLQMVGPMLIWAVLVIIPIFFTNTWWTGYLPINSWLAYDNTGKNYQIGRVLGADGKLDVEKYRQYSPVFLGAASTVRYGALFAILFASITFTALWYGKFILKTAKLAWQRKGGFAGRNDVHSRAMSQYKEVPEWVFATVGVVSAAFAFAGLYGYPTDTTGAIIPLTYVAAVIFILPIGVIAAISAYFTNLEIFFQIIGGYMFAGNLLGYVLLKTFSGGITNQALYFIQDMKLGHYAHVPPRQMVAAQVVATFLASFVSLAIVRFQINGIPDVCNSETQIHWLCSNAQTLYSGALQWGLIGAKRLFAVHTGLYHKMLYCFIAGLFWPIPWYLALKKWPNSFFRHCHPLLMMVGAVLWAPLNFSMTFQSLPLSWFFGVYLKTRFLPWWSKYAYVLSCALTTGIALSAIVQFIAISNPNITVPDWWGTTQYASTCDFQTCRWKHVPTGETFGPKTWE